MNQLDQLIARSMSKGRLARTVREALRSAAAEPGRGLRLPSGEACRQAILHHLESARSQCDICISAKSDPKINRALERIHRSGVRVRIVTDVDMDRLARVGVPIRVDRTEAHLHHRFALIDRALVLTEIYGGVEDEPEPNRKDVIVSSNPRTVQAFSTIFETLWERFE